MASDETKSPLNAFAIKELFRLMVEFQQIVREIT